MMERLGGKCPGDCTRCQLLADGKVEMELCMMDQVFQRTQRNEKKLDAILELIRKDSVPKGMSLVREPETEIPTNEEAGL